MNAHTPLTAAKVVDTVYTDLAVLDFRDGKIFVRNMAPGLTKAELKSLTEAPLVFN